MCYSPSWRGKARGQETQHIGGRSRCATKAAPRRSHQTPCRTQKLKLISERLRREQPIKRVLVMMRKRMQTCEVVGRNGEKFHDVAAELIGDEIVKRKFQRELPDA